MVKRPQDTGCTSIELPNEGVTNGVIKSIKRFYPIEYDEETDTYRVGEYDE